MSNKEHNGLTVSDSSRSESLPTPLEDPSPINAFKRAATELNEGIEVKLDDYKVTVLGPRAIR